MAIYKYNRVLSQRPINCIFCNVSTHNNVSAYKPKIFDIDGFRHKLSTTRHMMVEYHHTLYRKRDKN